MTGPYPGHTYLPPRIFQMSYVTKLEVFNIRNIHPFEITISEKKNIIITGKNGSGKTTLLENIRDEISRKLKWGDTTTQYFEAYKRLEDLSKTRRLNSQEEDQLRSLATMGGYRSPNYNFEQGRIKRSE
ncbi:hypothetical protein CCL14_06460 [Pseudomonas syringae]|uniref:AAA family ATPase n=1 Tax=Pseudomonas syringae TaxID=317 RepID=UPI000BB5B43B|nr:hypothetical protein CCL14_06460 [Pseudomonas syringae]